MRIFLVRPLLTVVFVLFLSSFKGFSQKGIINYDLPASNSSGLTKFFFSYTPSFRVEKWKDHAVLFVRLNLVMSTPGNMQSSYWYNYRFNGKEYGDQIVGRDVFNPIRVDQFRFHIRVQGSSLIEQLTYIKGWDEMKVGKVSLTAKPEDFHVFIEDLVSVDFTGTGPIQNKINALLAAEKQKALDEEKKKNDAIAADKKKQDDLEKQKQADAEKKKKAEAEAKAKQGQPANTNATQKTNTTGASAKADDDFWETGKKSSSANPGNNTVNFQSGIDKSKLPEFFRTTDGKYYNKQGDNIQEVSYDDYMALKKQKSDEKTTQQNNANKLTPQQQQKAVDDIMTKIKSDQQRQKDFEKDLVNKTNQFTSALAISAQGEETRRELKENSTMQGNYQSVEQLMADFNQKMANINSNVATLHEQRNAYVNSMSDAMYSDRGEEAFNQGAKLIGTIINSAKEAKEKKEAQARLKAQKEAALARFQAEEVKLLTNIRTDLFKRFREGALPLSSSKLEASTIYYFVYAYNPAQIGSKEAVLYVSNVFAVDRYSDGTWPFKTAITNDLSKLTPYSEVLHGYYLSKEEAESMRKGMTDIFVKTGGSTTALTYKGKASSGSSKMGSTDFWENGSKPTSDSKSKEKKPVIKDDFWNN
jgi:hypothetical protein